MSVFGLMSSSYPRGSVCLFPSHKLWHGVTDWQPTAMTPKDLTVPGRISWVWYTEKRAAEWVAHMTKEELNGLVADWIV
jgi:2-polyprenyl-6-methoxyphenol hydroxylase-like FAD-dependent oxidoreductase